jgi:cobalt-zinc-cadmium efflux system membrane fusion protein
MRLTRCAALLAAVLSAGCDNTVKTEAPPAAKVSGESIVFPPDSPQLSSLASEAAAQREAAAATLNGRLTWNEDKTVRIYTPFAGRVSRISAQRVTRSSRVRRWRSLLLPTSVRRKPTPGGLRAIMHWRSKIWRASKTCTQNGVAPAKDLNSAEAEYARSESELQRNRARLQLYGGGTQVDQSYALKSPLAGVVVEKNINPGQELRPDQMGGSPALFVITDPSYLWVMLDAGEKDLPGLHVGKIVKIRVPVYPDATFDARITAVADFLDPTTRTIKVRASLDNSNRMLKGEMFVTATLNDESVRVLQVPSRAVFFQGGSHFLFVDSGQGTYTRRQVKVGDVYNGYITITSGLEPGQKVVSEGALLLQQMLQPTRVVK